MTEFSDLNLHPLLVKTVSELGYLSPMPIQAEVIPLMICGRDVIGRAQTGTGKTAAFALPILQRLEMEQKDIQALVLVPTRELAIQVAKAFATYSSQKAARILAVYGGQSYQIQISQLRRGVHVVVGTPGRLLDLIHKNVLDISHVNTVVLDEADEMLSMGFIEDIETILRETPATRQTALFSATLPTEIRRLAERYMRDPQSITIQGEQMTVETTEQRYYLVNETDKLAALTRLFEMEDISSALVFVRTKAGTGELANELTLRGFAAESLNGDLSQEAREHTMGRFRKNLIKVLVATDVAARGLDIEGISHVINFDLPNDPEIYVHRIGRTGRAGKTGIAISLLSPLEKRHLRQIESFTRHKILPATLPSEEDIFSKREGCLVEQMTKWLQRGRCRREREIVDGLIREGYDGLEIAAAALKVARADEKQRPIAAMSAVLEPKEFQSSRQGRRGYGNKANDNQSTVSHEPGMVRLSLNMGKKHGIRPNDIVGAIASHANIPGHVIGKIHIQEKHSLVDVPEALVPKVLSNSKTISIHRQPVILHCA